MKGTKRFFKIPHRFTKEIEDPPLYDSKSFSKVYEKNYLSIFRYVFGLRGGAIEDIEDLTAETFVRAWKSRQTFYGDLDGAATGWLMRIARRLVIDGYRYEKSRIQTVDELPDDLPHLGPTPEYLLEVGEQYQILWRLLQGLPDRQREILVLRFFLDWQVNQIGKYLQIPENTVSVYIRRALMQLAHDWPDDKEKFHDQIIDRK